MSQARDINTYRQLNIDIISGLFTGVFCSGLFNPWDRALYLSVKESRPFLSAANFKSPYQGFSQAVIQRAFLGSIYYIIQGEMKYNLYPYLRHTWGVSEPTAQFCIGLFAGSASGVLTNSISAIKYHTWGQENRYFLLSVREMWLQGGVKPFFKGTGATVSRDMVFGSTYEVLRNLMYSAAAKYQKSSETKNPYFEFICNGIAACIATVASGPFNYARTIQYATPPDCKPPSIAKALCSVWNESKKHKEEPLGLARFFQRQFRIGWGTARVGVGMAVGQKTFDWTRNKLTDYRSHY